MKTLLIPGYATQLRASIFRAPFPEHEGFIAFQPWIDRGEATVFHWGIRRNLSFFASMNPFSYLKLYKDEEALAHLRELQQKLFDVLTSSRTERIICHSMGCRLLLNTVNEIGLPSSVQSIVFLQADIDSNATYNVQQHMHEVQLHNYHCFWDQSLIASSVIHRNIRVGMQPWSREGVKNYFYPLLKPINLHTSPMRDVTLRERLFSGS